MRPPISQGIVRPSWLQWEPRQSTAPWRRRRAKYRLGVPFPAAPRRALVIWRRCHYFLGGKTLTHVHQNHLLHPLSHGTTSITSSSMDRGDRRKCASSSCGSSRGSAGSCFECCPSGGSSRFVRSCATINASRVLTTYGGRGSGGTKPPMRRYSRSHAFRRNRREKG